MSVLTRTFVASWIFVGFVPAQEPKPRPTLVRVVDLAAKPLAGAQVVFFSAPLDKVCPLYGQRIVTAKTDERGRVRVRVPGGAVWSAWAVHDGPNGRTASDVTQRVQLSRPLRIVTKPFPVAKVRLRGLAPWRKLFGGKLGCAFASALAPFASFRVALPTGDEPMLTLPPLPNGNYFPILTDDTGAFLDTRYFSPAFIDNAALSELYEREVPLKRVLLAKPYKVSLRVTDSNGRPLPGARIFVRPSYATLKTERRHVAGADGKVELVIPFREAEDGRGWYDIQVLVVVPGFTPWAHSFSKAPAADVEIEARLHPGRALTWSFKPGRNSEKLFLRTTFGSATGFRLDGVVPIEATAKGALVLPSPLETRGPRPAGAPPERVGWQLFSVRDGVVTTLFDESTVPSEYEVDVARLGEVELQLSSPGGEVHLCRMRGSVAVGSIPYAVDRTGVCRLRLMPGRHVLYAVHRRAGDALVRIDVDRGGRVREEVELTPFVRVEGIVSWPNEEAAAGAEIQWTPTVDGIDPQVFQSWHPNPIKTDDRGSFVLPISKLVTRIDLSSSVQRANQWFWGSAQIDPNRKTPVEITLQQ